MGILPAGYKAIPAAGMKVDSRGIPNRAQLKEMFGSLRTRIGVAKGRGKRMQVGTYAAIPAGTRSRLKPGIYYRTQRGIKPVLIFVPAAQYRKRMDLGQLADDVVGRDFEALFASAFAEAMATAR